MPDRSMISNKQAELGKSNRNGEANRFRSLATEVGTDADNGTECEPEEADYRSVDGTDPRIGMPSDHDSADRFTDCGRSSKKSEKERETEDVYDVLTNLWVRPRAGEE